MFLRIGMIGSLVVAALSIEGVAQEPPRRGIDQPRFTLPQAPGRTQSQQSTDQRAQPRPNPPQPLTPEDFRKALEGFFQDSYSDEEYIEDDRFERRQQAPPAPRRLVLSADRFSVLSVEQQQRLLRLAVVSLEEDLDRLAGGEGWKDYLHLRALLRVVTGQSAEPPGEDDRLRLQTISGQFDAVAENARYKRITGLWGFKTLQTGLPVYAAEPRERQRLAVRGHSRQFQAALAEVKGGQSWVGYFHLPVIDRWAQAGRPPTPDEEKVMREASQRMTQAAANASYAKITRMQGFDETRRALQQIASSRQQAAKASQSGDADDMERVAEMIRQNLADLKQSREEEARAKKVLATLQAGTSEEEKTRQVLQEIKRRHDEQSRQADEALEELLAEIKRRRQSDRALQTLSLASQNGLEIIKKLQAYDASGKDVAGFKVLKKRDGSDALETKKLTLADRDRARRMMQSVTAYRQQDCARRVRLKFPPRDPDNRAAKTEKLADQDRIVEIIKKMFEQNEDDTEYILMQFEDVPEPEEVTLMQFEDVEDPPEYILMQFEDVPEPAEVTLMQFSDVTKKKSDDEKDDKKKKDGDSKVDRDQKSTEGDDQDEGSE